jgi:predicted  nucleic acid-binding Zn-ribbon protein
MRPILDDLLTINTRLNEENHKQQNQLKHLTAELGNMKQELIRISKELQDIRGSKFYPDQVENIFILLMT